MTRHAFQMSERRELLRSYERDIEEHALRLFAAQRDFPGIDHRGTEPEVLRHVAQSDLAKIQREFWRRA